MPQLSKVANFGKVTDYKIIHQLINNNMITIDQLKDVLERESALRRYL